MSGITNIEVFELSSKSLNHKAFTIAYTKPPQKQSHLKVSNSDDGNQAIFSNGIEHYIHNGRSQANFPWIKDKYIRAATTAR